MQRGKWAYFSLKQDALEMLAGWFADSQRSVLLMDDESLGRRCASRCGVATRSRRRPWPKGASGSCGSGSCCARGESDAVKFGEALYNAEQRGELPEAAALASLGCGNPTAVAELRRGEAVLDLGSGGGIDVILSAKRVGPTGVAYGLDMTDEMLALARQNAREAGVTNVHFLKGVIEADPAARRLGRRRDLELRDQPLDRQGCGPDRDAPCSSRADASASATSSPRTGSRRRSGPSAARFVGCIAGALS